MKDFTNLPKSPYSDYIQAHIRAEEKAKELAKQQELDFQKWLESEYRNTDLSGLMPWCMFCDCCIDRVCKGLNREENCLCAKAYKTMRERLGK